MCVILVRQGVCVILAQPRLVQLRRETEVCIGSLFATKGTDRGLEALPQVAADILRFCEPLRICHCIAAQCGDGGVGIVGRGGQGFADSATQRHEGMHIIVHGREFTLRHSNTFLEELSDARATQFVVLHVVRALQDA